MLTSLINNFHDSEKLVVILIFHAFSCQSLHIEEHLIHILASRSSICSLSPKPELSERMRQRLWECMWWLLSDVSLIHSHKSLPQSLSGLLEETSNVLRCVAIDQVSNEPVRCVHKSESVSSHVSESQLFHDDSRGWLSFSASWVARNLLIWMCVIRDPNYEHICSEDCPFDCLDSCCI